MNMCSSQSKSSMLRWLFGALIPQLVVENQYYSRMYPLSDHLSRLIEETGYMHIQATKPDTIGTCLQGKKIFLTRI